MQQPIKKISNLTLKRVKRDREYLENNPDLLPTNISWQCKNDFEYVIQIQGIGDKPIKGSWIIADLILPNDYPSSPPMVTFRNDFKHINIWEGTYKLCMYYINPSYYTSQTTLIQIINGVNEVMHDPTPNDPANGSLSAMYKENPQNYTKFMMEQSIKFSDPKYKIL